MKFKDDRINVRVENAKVNIDNGSAADTKYKSNPNIQRILEIFPETKWEKLFPERLELFSYDNFLRAASKYVRFCDEVPVDATIDSDQNCRKILAYGLTLLIFFSQDLTTDLVRRYSDTTWTLGLTQVAEHGCPLSDHCKEYVNHTHPYYRPFEKKDYYGRGSGNISNNEEYGIFSERVTGNKQTFLENPDMVSTDGVFAILSGIFRLKSYNDLAPSVIDIIDGTWEPNNVDLKNNNRKGFGSILNILNWEEFCTDEENPMLKTMMMIHKEVLNFFDLKTDYSETSDCLKSNPFLEGGSGHIKTYWCQSPTAATTAGTNIYACEVCAYAQEFSIMNQNGYSKCIEKVKEDMENKPVDPVDDDTTTNPKPDEQDLIKINEDESFTILNPFLKRVVNSASILPGPLTISDDIQNEPENVKLFASIVTSDIFDEIFPARNIIYTYIDLLIAVKRYPFFCGETGMINKDTPATMIDILKRESCILEIATLFAHFIQETSERNSRSTLSLWKQGLFHVTEMGCPGDGKCWGYYSYNAEHYPAPADKQFYGRGPFQISWNYNYGFCSKILLGNKYYFLEDPDLVYNDKQYLFQTAMFFYMTPQPPKPSMHESAANLWNANQADRDSKNVQGFGATINIINGALECGINHSSTSMIQAQYRIQYYEALLKHLKLNRNPDESYHCQNSQPFPSDGNANYCIYWDRDWDSSDDKCKCVTWQTEFSLISPDSYKNCVKSIKNEPYEESNQFVNYQLHIQFIHS